MQTANQIDTETALDALADAWAYYAPASGKEACPAPGNAAQSGRAGQPLGKAA